MKKAFTISSVLWISLWFTVVGLSVWEGRRRSSTDMEEFYAAIVTIGMKERLITNDKGVILYCSATAAELAGYMRTELENKSAEMLIPERYRVVHREKFAAAIERHDELVRITRCELLTKSGKERQVEMRSRVIASDLGTVALLTITPIESFEKP